MQDVESIWKKEKDVTITILEKDNTVRVAQFQKSYYKKTNGVMRWRKNKMSNKKFYRQGDVIFHETSEVKGEEVEQKGEYVVAVGEATGHSHTLLCEAMTIKKDKRNFAVLEQEAEIIHQQHKKLKIEKGQYAQVQEREVDHFSNTVRKVVD